MNANFLTDDDIEELTGYSQAHHQCKTLRDHGIIYVERRDGKPRTTWYNVNHPTQTRTAANDQAPNFEAM